MEPKTMTNFYGVCEFLLKKIKKFDHKFVEWLFLCLLSRAQKENSSDQKEMCWKTSNVIIIFFCCLLFVYSPFYMDPIKADGI